MGLLEQLPALQQLPPTKLQALQFLPQLRLAGLQPQRHMGLQRQLALWQQLPLMPQAQRKKQSSNEFQKRKTPGETIGRAKCHNGCAGASDTFDTQ
jgi:hypothetical protein